jgi:16S rRNA (uracil1498-N3)-methyltransferase
VEAKMTRFFIPSEQIQGNSIILKGSDRHHLLNVLRREVGSKITVLNGRGAEYEAVIREIGPDFVTGEIVATITRATEPQSKIRLVQSLPKADKFELLLQKNTEVGVSFFQPVFTERSTIKLEPGTVLKKEERWRKIISEAAEQSGRKIIPELEPVRSWNQVMATLSERPGLVLIPWEGEREASLKKVLEGTSGIPEMITIFIGPEGGFSQAEVNQARDKGAVPVTLGSRILRTETAGLVVATAILYHYGDLD